MIINERGGGKQGSQLERLEASFYLNRDLADALVS